MLKISNLLSSLKNLNKFNKNLFHTSLSVNGTQYYPINDEVFGLNEDQKQVYMILLNHFLNSKIIVATYIKESQQQNFLDFYLQNLINQSHLIYIYHLQTLKY